MAVHKIFHPEPTRVCYTLFHIQYSSPTYKNYFFILKSEEFTVFWLCFLQLRRFCASKYVKMALPMSKLSSNLKSLRTQICKKLSYGSWL